MILLATIISSCNEINQNIDSNKTNVESYSIIQAIDNSNNPYENVGRTINDALLYANTNSSEGCGDSCYIDLINNYLDSISFSINLPTTLLSTEEREYFLEYQDFVFSDNITIVIDSLISLEDEVNNSSSLSTQEKERLLVVFSTIKYLFYTAQIDGIRLDDIDHYMNISDDPSDFDWCYRSCIDRKMTFDNWIDEAAFYATAPGSILVVLASCAWNCRHESKN